MKEGPGGSLKARWTKPTSDNDIVGSAGTATGAVGAAVGVAAASDAAIKGYLGTLS